MSRRPTGSKLQALDACLGSGILPDTDGVASDTEYRDEAADRGTQIHAYLERIGNGMPQPEALAGVPEKWRGFAEVLDLPRLPVDPARWAREVAFAIDWESGAVRELGRGLGREYGEIGPTELPLTMDAIGLEGVDGVYVADDKTGKLVAPARENWQLHAGAYAAAVCYGRKRATVQIIYHRPDGSAWFDTAHPDAFDLRVWFGRFQRLMRAWASAVEAYERSAAIPPLRPGQQCRYCPARLTCPELTARVQALTPAAVAGYRPLTKERAGAAWLAIKQIEPLITEMKSQILKMSAIDPIPLGDGVWLGKMPPKFERKLDGETTRRVVAEKYGTQVALAAVPPAKYASWDALSEALRPIVKQRQAEGWRLTLRGAVDEVAQLVEADDGMLRRQRGGTLGEYREELPKPEPPAPWPPVPEVEPTPSPRCCRKCGEVASAGLCAGCAL